MDSYFTGARIMDIRRFRLARLQVVTCTRVTGEVVRDRVRIANKT